MYSSVGLFNHPAWPVRQTFVINLKRNTDRLENMNYQLKYLSIPFKSVEALDAKVLIDELKQNKTRDPTYNGALDPRIKLKAAFYSSDWFYLGKGIGHGGHHAISSCASSHMHAWLAAMDSVESGEALDGPILIFEDDLSLSADFATIVSEIVAQSRWPFSFSYFYNDWGILGLGHGSYPPHTWIERLLGPRIVSTSGFSRAHAYVLRDVSVAKLLFELATRDPMHMPVADRFWWTLTQNGTLPAYKYVLNDIAVQTREVFGTNIVAPADGIEKHFTVRVPIPHPPLPPSQPPRHLSTASHSSPQLRQQPSIQSLKY